MKTAIHNEDLREFRQLFISEIQKQIIGLDNIYISLSGGIDSSIIMFALLELKAKFKCITFRTEGYVSPDFRSAKKMCEVLGIEFVPLVLKTDLDSLYEGAKSVASVTGKKKKTIIECCYPYLHLSKKIPNTTLLTGLGADDLYCNQRKVQVELHKFGEDYVKKYRKVYTDDSDFSNFNIIKICKLTNVNCIDVYNSKEITEFFNKFTVGAINKKHKLLSVGAFSDYFNKIGGYREHSSFQVNSKLRDDFSGLIKSKYNTTNSKSVVSIYNRL